MKCAASCGAIFFAGQTVIEVAGQLFCPVHVREVTISRDGRVPIKPEQIQLRRSRYEPIDQP